MIDRVGLLTISDNTLYHAIIYACTIEEASMHMNMKQTVKAAVLFCILVAADLSTKAFAVQVLEDGRHVELIHGVLEFYYIQNRGAAFGIFQNGTVILSFISLIALILLIVLYFRVPAHKKYLPLRIVLIFIAAGAAGNLIDRVLLHYVRDFIYFSLIDFPVFNVADIYVTCSVFVLAYLIMFYYKEEDLEFLGR